MITKPCILRSRTTGHKGIPDRRHQINPRSNPRDDIEADRECPATKIMAHQITLSELCEHEASSDLWLDQPIGHPHTEQHRQECVAMLRDHRHSFSGDQAPGLYRLERAGATDFDTNRWPSCR